MKKLCHLSNNILIVSISLIVFFPPGAFSHCDDSHNAHVQTPKEMDALIGSCVDVPCIFDHMDGFDSRKPIYAIWTKNRPEFGVGSSYVVFNSSGSVNTYQIEMTGDLRTRNCSIRIPDLTTDHGDQYYFRFENGPLKASFCKDIFRLTVTDSPKIPSIVVSGSDLKEHQSITVTCSAYTPCSHSPPELSWNIRKDSVRQIEKKTDGAFTTKFQETITLLDTHNGFGIKCYAKYPVKGGFKQAVATKTLSVSYAPQETFASISPSGLVTPGTRVVLSCSTRAQPSPSFAWFKNIGHGPIKVSSTKTFSFSVTEREAYYCEVKNSLGSDKSNNICVDIIDAPFTPSIRISTGNLKEHRPVTVTCSAFTACPQSPPELTWNLQPDSLRQTEENKDGTFTTKIQESFTLSDTHDGFIIRCSAKHPAAEKDNVVKTEVTLDVSYAPKDTSASFSPSDFVKEGSWVKLSCSSNAKPSPTITWFKKDSQKFTKVATGIFHKVKYIEGDRYYCEAANKLGKQKSSPISFGEERTPGLWIYVIIGIFGIGALSSTPFIITKWLKTASSSQAH